jgi:hypothetical protein
MSPWPAPDENDRRVWWESTLGLWAIRHPRVKGGHVDHRVNGSFALGLACAERHDYG